MAYDLADVIQIEPNTWTLVSDVTTNVQFRSSGYMTLWVTESSTLPTEAPTESNNEINPYRKIVSSSNDNKDFVDYAFVKRTKDLYVYSKDNKTTALKDIGSLTQPEGDIGQNFQLPTGENELASTAFGTQKVAFDESVFYGMFSLDVNDEMWIEKFNSVERDKTSATSVDGKLRLISNSGISTLASKRHPRYRPNRGFIYSDSGFISNATSSNGTLKAVRRTTLSGVTSDTKSDPIDITNYDLSKGNIKDIQMQWRGVGNQGFFLNLAKLYDSEILGTLSELSIANPALPISFECTNQGIVRFGAFTEQNGIFFEWEFDTPQETELFVGCVDISSEGGGTENRRERFIPTPSGNSFYSNSNGGEGTVTIAFRIPETIQYNGNSTIYTRDAVIKEISSFCRGDEINLEIYKTRNTTAFDAVFASDGALVKNSFIEYILGGTDSGGTFNVPALQTAFETEKPNLEFLRSRRADNDVNAIIEFSTKVTSETYLTAGDIVFVLTRNDAGIDLIWSNVLLEEEV